MKTKIVTSFYLFTKIQNPKIIGNELKLMAENYNLKGTIILAEEGINAGMSGEKESMIEFIQKLQDMAEFKYLEYKSMVIENDPFAKLKIKIKKEIVTFKQCNCSPVDGVGQYIEPNDWNKVINDPEFSVIDVRNNYEFEAGTFKNSINPKTNTFTEFAQFVDSKFPNKEQKIAMFCTGGIRCEKSTAYLVQKGYKTIVHLKGGILNYLKQVPASESLWQGTCFVFDDRQVVSKEEVEKTI